MAYVTIPLTGTGDATAQVAVDRIGGIDFQLMKLADGIEGSTGVVPALSSAPNSTDVGLLVRQIGGGTTSVDLSSGGSTKLVGRVTIDSPSTSMELSSGGSTRLVGQVTVANPSTIVEISSAGSTRLIGRVSIDSGTTTVDANLSSVGSTKLVGQVTVANPTTAVTVSSGVILAAGSSANVLGSVTIAGGSTANTAGSVALLAGTSGNIIGTVINGPATTGTLIGNVSVSSGVVLGAGSSANIIGTVINGAATTATLIGNVAVSSGVVLGAGSTANSIGSVALVAGTTANSIGAVALVAGSSASVVGQVAISSANQVFLGQGTSATYNFVQSIPYSSGNTARSTVNTSIDVSIIAANANRKALIIAAGSTAQTVGIGLSTSVVTTALANVNLYITPGSQLVFGGPAGLPLFLGPIRGINLTSTAVAGGVNVTEFS